MRPERHVPLSILCLSRFSAQRQRQHNQCSRLLCTCLRHQQLRCCHKGGVACCRWWTAAHSTNPVADHGITHRLQQGKGDPSWCCEAPCAVSCLKALFTGSALKLPEAWLPEVLKLLVKAPTPKARFAKCRLRSSPGGQRRRRARALSCGLGSPKTGPRPGPGGPGPVCSKACSTNTDERVIGCSGGPSAGVLSQASCARRDCAQAHALGRLRASLGLA